MCLVQYRVALWCRFIFLPLAGHGVVALVSCQGHILNGNYIKKNRYRIKQVVSMRQAGIARSFPTMAGSNCAVICISIKPKYTHIHAVTHALVVSIYCLRQNFLRLPRFPPHSPFSLPPSTPMRNLVPTLQQTPAHIPPPKPFIPILGQVWLPARYQIEHALKTLPRERRGDENVFTSLNCIYLYMYTVSTVKKRRPC